MPSTTIYSATSDGYIESTDGTYANARAGTGEDVSAISGTELRVGQVTGFAVDESFLNFDISGIPAGSTVDSATLSLWLTNDFSTTDFVTQARARDWGDTLESGDFVAGDDLSALTLLASIDSSGIGSTGAYKALTSEAALATAIESAIVGDGTLRLILCSSRTVGNNQPTGSEYLIFSSADETGTGQDPKLDVTYTIPTARQFTAANVEYFTRAPAAAHAVGDVDLWMAAWVYPDTVAGSMMIITQDDLGDRTYVLYLDKDSGDGFSIFNLQTFAKAKVDMTTLVDTWYFLFAWRTAADDTWHITVNLGTPSTVVEGSPITAGTANFSIGAIEGGVAAWNGRIARVGFAKPPTALGDGTDGTLAYSISRALYNEGIGLYWSEISAGQRTAWGLVAGSGVYHDLDDGSGNAIEQVDGLDLTDVNTVTAADGPDGEGEESPSSSSSSSSSSVEFSSSSSSSPSSLSSLSSLSSVEFSSSSSSSSSSPSSQSSSSSSSPSSSLSSVEFSSSSSSSSSSLSSESSSASSPSSQSSDSSASSESSSSSSSSSSVSSSSSSSSSSSLSSLSSLSSQSSDSSSSTSSSSSLSSSSSSSPSSASSLSSSSPSSSSPSSLSSSSSIVRFGTGERIVLVVP